MCSWRRSAFLLFATAGLFTTLATTYSLAEPDSTGWSSLSESSVDEELALNPPGPSGVLPDPAREIKWSLIDDGIWPEGLPEAAKQYVSGFSRFDKMDLYPPVVATTTDSTTWAVFTVGVTGQPEYEHLVVVMKNQPNIGWAGVSAGTGIGRSDVLPPELLKGDFGTPPLEDW